MILIAEKSSLLYVTLILLRKASKQSYPFYPAENYYKSKGTLI